MADIDSRTSTTSTQKRVNITVAKDSMSATVILRKPLPDDPSITVDEVMRELAEANIVYGIDNAAVENAVSQEEYNTPIKVASGMPPERGENSQFIYHFDTSQDHRPQMDDDGRIDYKNINFVQNVHEGQELVTKVPAKACVPGTNIFGKPIKGPDGRNLPFNHGINTKVTEDDTKLIATASGAIVYLYGKVAVNDVMVVKGDVDIGVGNIECLGSVKVTGDVKAGFELKIDGDLEVNGNIEDCNIDVKGNIMVKGGFFGHGAGVMRAGGEVFVKFVEGQKIESGGDINVGGEVINCQVTTKGNVIVKGKKGKIVGGEVRANKEIRASILGSDAGTATVLAVAYDSELIRRYYESLKEISRLKEDGERIKEVLYSLYRLQLDGKLSKDQAEALQKLQEFQKELPQNIENLEAETREIKEALEKLDDAKIVAEETIYPGVRATFGLVYRDILEEAHQCMLKLEGTKVLFSEYRGEN